MRRNGAHREFRQQVPESMIPISQGTVKPLQPFDFGKSCSIYARFDGWTHTAFIDGVLYKGFEEKGAVHLLEVCERKGEMEAQALQV